MPKMPKWPSIFQRIAKLLYFISLIVNGDDGWNESPI